MGRKRSGPPWGSLWLIFSCSWGSWPVSATPTLGVAALFLFMGYSCHPGVLCDHVSRDPALPVRCERSLENILPKCSCTQKCFPG